MRHRSDHERLGLGGAREQQPSSLLLEHSRARPLELQRQRLRERLRERRGSAWKQKLSLEAPEALGKETHDLIFETMLLMSEVRRATNVTIK